MLSLENSKGHSEFVCLVAYIFLRGSAPHYKRFPAKSAFVFVEPVSKNWINFSEPQNWGYKTQMLIPTSCDRNRMFTRIAVFAIVVWIVVSGTPADAQDHVMGDPPTLSTGQYVWNYTGNYQCVSSGGDIPLSQGSTAATAQGCAENCVADSPNATALIARYDSTALAFSCRCKLDCIELRNTTLPLEVYLRTASAKLRTMTTTARGKSRKPKPAKPHTHPHHQPKHKEG